MPNFNNPLLGNNYYGSQPMFPQPNGNVYLISNSLEVANVPAGAGITAALCSQENLLYLKTVQNGVPTFLAYKLSPYTEGPRTTISQSQETSTSANEPTYETRLVAVEKQLQTIISLLSGGKRNDELQPNANVQSQSQSQPATSTSEWS